MAKWIPVPNGYNPGRLGMMEIQMGIDSGAMYVFNINQNRKVWRIDLPENLRLCQLDDPDDGGGVSLPAATVAALRVLVYGESYCGPDAPTMEDAHRLIKQLLADVAQDKGGTRDE